MWKKVQDHIRENQLLVPGDRVIVALSGGADSVCLLSVLDEIRHQGATGNTGISDLELRAVHVHHGLRGEEADRDAEYVKTLCAQLKIPLVTVYRQVEAYAKEHGLSTEEAGRILRYEAFRQEAERWGGPVKIAVAHHRDDSAETILHHLVRGSGLKGLSGIRPKQGDRIRPLLCVSRKEILDYLNAHGLAWCEDSTNDSLDYTRNRIRNEILPRMTETINTRAVENILHAGEIFAQADAYLEAQSRAVWEQYGSSGTETGAGRPKACITLDGFCAQPEIIRTYLIRHMLDLVVPGWKDITSRHFVQVAELAEKQVGSRFDLPGGVCAVRGYDVLELKAGKRLSREKAEQKKAAGESRELFISLPGITSDEAASADFADREMTLTALPFTSGTLHLSVFLQKKDREIPKNQYTKWFDYDRIKGTLSLRYRRTGDYLMLPGGGSKAITRYMIDEKIPRELRDQIPVLTEGDHVLWVVGYRISEYYKITNATKTILQVDFNGGKENGR